MTTVNPYLTFYGNCAEAFNFYKSAFGGEFHRMSKYKDMPPIPGMEKIPDSANELIMHIALPINLALTGW
jgi:PhnB protein